MSDTHKILERIEFLQREIERLRHENGRQFDRLDRLVWFLINHNRFTIFITQEGNPMAIGNLTSPGTATLLLALLDNGAPFTPPAGSTYVFTPSLTCDDTNVSVSVDPSNPLQFNVSIPAGDPSTVADFTATAAAPDGTTATGALAIPFAAQPQNFTIGIQQTA